GKGGIELLAALALPGLELGVALGECLFPRALAAGLSRAAPRLDPRRELPRGGGEGSISAHRGIPPKNLPCPREEASLRPGRRHSLPPACRSFRSRPWACRSSLASHGMRARTPARLWSSPGPRGQVRASAPHAGRGRGCRRGSCRGRAARLPDLVGISMFPSPRFLRCRDRTG